MYEKPEIQGVASKISRISSGTIGSDELNAELLFLKRDSDAKLDIDPDSDMPDWIVPGAEVFLNIVWPSKGVVVFVGEVTYVLGQRIHIGNLKFKETIQRRKDVKVHYSGKGTLYTEDRQGAFPVMFKNISASGAGFLISDTPEAREAITEGGACILSFQPFDDRILELTSTVIRANPVESTGRIDCGIAFKNVKPGIEMNLRQLVFKMQKEENIRDRAANRFDSIQIDVFM